MKLIDKSALVAEIERRRDFIYQRNPLLINSKYCIEEDNAILDFINTLETKTVDLEKEIHSWMEDNTCRGYCSVSIRDTAEHFFELGLKAQKGE